jgi:hypothetical protein
LGVLLRYGGTQTLAPGDFERERPERLLLKGGSLLLRRHELSAGYDTTASEVTERWVGPRIAADWRVPLGPVEGRLSTADPKFVPGWARGASISWRSGRPSARLQMAAISVSNPRGVGCRHRPQSGPYDPPMRGRVSP